MNLNNIFQIFKILLFLVSHIKVVTFMIINFNCFPKFEKLIIWQTKIKIIIIIMQVQNQAIYPLWFIIAFTMHFLSHDVTFLDGMTCALCITEGKMVIFFLIRSPPLHRPLSQSPPFLFFLPFKALKSKFHKVATKNPIYFLFVHFFSLSMRWKFVKSPNNFSSPRITKFPQNFPKISPNFLKGQNETLTLTLFPNMLLPIKELEVKKLLLNSMSSLQCQPFISFLGERRFRLGALAEVTWEETIDGREKEEGCRLGLKREWLLPSLIKKMTIFLSVTRRAQPFCPKM